MALDENIKRHLEDFRVAVDAVANDIPIKKRPKYYATLMCALHELATLTDPKGDRAVLDLRDYFNSKCVESIRDFAYARKS